MTNRTRGRAGLLRRHKAAAVLVLLVTVLLAMVGAWAVYLNSQLQRVPRIDAGIRPPSASGDDGSARDGRGVNILLAGTDSRRPAELVRLVRSGWTPGAMRSDTIMLFHLSADRRSAYLISIPRDTWTFVPGYGNQKINAAFSYGGPALYVRTIEDFTGLHVDHLAVVDWEGFKSLSQAVGGVDVTVPRTVTDPTTGTRWPRGTVHLEGDRALQYVRMRHGLANGDLDRINRQQNFLRAMMGKLLSTGTTTNPVTLTKVARSLTSRLTLDSGFSNGDVRRLAFSMRHLRTGNVTFVTVPLKGFGRVDGQSVVLVDRRVTRQLFGSVVSDDLDGYLARNGIPQLPAEGQVS